MVHSRARSGSIATSSTTATPLPSRSWTTRSSSSASTRVSAARCSNRRMLTRPVVMTWPPSMLVTRVIGRKTRRRPGTSTTRPMACGRARPGRKTTTTSRTRPTWSPCGSKTARPDMRATKTRLGAPLTVARLVRADRPAKPGPAMRPVYLAWRGLSRCSPSRYAGGQRMVELDFETVDVFADRAFSGNPLAVVRGAGALSTAQLQAIASEFNLSETAFPMVPTPGAGRGRCGVPAADLHPADRAAVRRSPLGRDGLGAGPARAARCRDRAAVDGRDRTGAAGLPGRAGDRAGRRGAAGGSRRRRPARRRRP